VILQNVPNCWRDDSAISQVSFFREALVDQKPDFPPFEPKELANEKKKKKKKRFFFQQEMASSSSHNNNDIPLATLLEWYKIRDTCFGDNFVDQNIPLALELASSCQHPDARWFTEACAGKDVTTKEDAHRVFSALRQNDARALCFGWMFDDDDEEEDWAPLRHSAELGFAFAQGVISGWAFGEEKFKFAQLAAAQSERDGFYELGLCFCDGEGCEQDLDKAKENFLLASELGHVWAMNRLGGLLNESDSQRWRWLGRAAGLGRSYLFLASFVKQVELLISGAESAGAVFAIGQALQGHVNEGSRTIFNDGDDFESLIVPAKQAIAFYETQIHGTRNAMHAWTQVGMRWKVVKDVRKLIAKLIWDSREEALFSMSARQLKEASQGVPSARAVRAQKRARK
jgi:hypothetical protein